MHAGSWVLHAREGQQWYSLPEEGLAHGLVGVQSTRLGGMSDAPYDTLNLGLSVGDAEEVVRENRGRFCRTIGIDPGQIVSLDQVHGTRVVVPSGPGPQGEGDALVTSKPGLFLSLTVADCCAVFLVETRRRILALAHAGWRGTCRRIVAETIQFMVDEFGANPARIVAGFGPSIGSCCYDVDESVRESFAERGWEWEAVASRRWDGAWELDLQQANGLLLRRAGVPGPQVIPSPACTSCRDDLLFSHRRSGGKTGRMLAILGWREE
jgi:YfiH family protein